MLHVAEHEPHFEREARMLTFPYFRQCCAANSSTRRGRVAFAATRRASICSGVISAALLPLALRWANFSFVAKIQSLREWRNSKALCREAYGGNESRTSPEGLTDSDMRLERLVQQSVTLPICSSHNSSFIASIRRCADVQPQRALRQPQPIR